MHTLLELGVRGQAMALRQLPRLRQLRAEFALPDSSKRGSERGVPTSPACVAAGDLFLGSEHLLLVKWAIDRWSRYAMMWPRVISGRAHRNEGN